MASTFQFKNRTAIQVQPGWPVQSPVVTFVFTDSSGTPQPGQPTVVLQPGAAQTVTVSSLPADTHLAARVAWSTTSLTPDEAVVLVLPSVLLPGSAYYPDLLKPEMTLASDGGPNGSATTVTLTGNTLEFQGGTLEPLGPVPPPATPIVATLTNTQSEPVAVSVAMAPPALPVPVPSTADPLAAQSFTLQPGETRSVLGYEGLTTLSLYSQREDGQNPSYVFVLSQGTTTASPVPIPGQTSGTIAITNQTVARDSVRQTVTLAGDPSPVPPPPPIPIHPVIPSSGSTGTTSNPIPPGISSSSHGHPASGGLPTWGVWTLIGVGIACVVVAIILAVVLPKRRRTATPR